MLDAGDELVCPACGITNGKEVVEGGSEGVRKVPRFGSYALGSFMGAGRQIAKNGGRRFRGLDGSGRRYGYLKSVSDFTGREEGVQIDCSKIIERVGELLRLPRVTIVEATAMSRKVFGAPHAHHRVTAASVSAHCLISACKVGGVCSVDAQEIVRAHEPFGKVTTASVMRLAFESPIRTDTRRPEEFVVPIIGRLSGSTKLARSLSEDGIPAERFLRSLAECSREILAKLEGGARWGKRPRTLAATSIYAAERTLAGREKRKPRISQRELAECVGSSEYTIREQFSSCFRGVADATESRRPSHLPATEGKIFPPAR
jgi:transcription initiation factor TFIIIB Brf1 subunit/transcription initiation factor TFIIB